MPLFSIARFLPVVLFPRKQTPNELRELVICELMFNFRKKKRIEVLYKISLLFAGMCEMMLFFFGSDSDHCELPKKSIFSS